MTLARLVAAAAAVLLAGCPSFSTMGTARTIPKGSNQFHVGMGGHRDLQATTDLAFQGVILQGQLGLLFGG